MDEIKDLFKKALSKHREGFLIDAKIIYEEIMKINESHDGTNFNLASINANFGNYKDAILLLKNTVKINPQQKLYWSTLIEVMIIDGLNEEVNEIFKSDLFINLNKNLKDELLNIVEINLQDESTKKIITGNLKIDTLNLINTFKDNNLNQAKIIAIGIIRKYPSNITALKILGSIRLVNKDFFEALKINNKILKLKSNDFEVLNNLGLIYMNLNNYIQSEFYFNKAIEVESNNPNCHFNLASLYIKNGENDLAISSLKRTISINKLFYDAVLNLGFIYLKKLDFNNAKYYFNNAIEIKPESSEAYYNLALTHQKSKEFQLAKLNYEKSIIYNPKYAHAYNNLGIILTQSGEIDESIIKFSRALELISNFQEALFNLANSYLKINNLNNAVDCFNSLYEMDKGKYGLLAKVNVAILYYLKSNYIGCHTALEDARLIIGKKEEFFENKIIYWQFLSKLIKKKNINFIQSKNIIDKIYVVGDSHALTYHGLNLQYRNQNYLLESHWIEGCKQWHLGNDFKNQYKYQFHKIIEGIPDCSIVIFSFGEIDCRINEGVLKHFKNNSQLSISDIQKSTVVNYLKFIFNFKKSRNFQIIIQGIPSPNTSLGNENEFYYEFFIKSVNEFNLMLKSYSAQCGFEFIDLHAHTNRGDGRSNSMFHIDEHHLSPEAIIEYWTNNF